MLVDALVEFGERHKYLSAQARVAAELDANKFWDSQSFRIIDQITEKKRAINVRRRDFNGTSWLEALPDVEAKNVWRRPILKNLLFFLDLNVFFDVIKNRSFSDDGEMLISLGLMNHIRLYVSSEFRSELARNRLEDDKTMRIAKAFPSLKRVEDKDIEELESEIRSIVFPERSMTRRNAPQDASDVRHLAEAVYYKAGFVTREKAILRTASDLKKSFDIEILSPVDLLEAYLIKDLSSVHKAVPTESELRFESLSKASAKQIASLARRISYRPSTVVETLSITNLDEQAGVNLSALANGELVGALTSWTSGGPSLITAKIFVDERHPLAQLVIDHFLELLKPKYCDRFVCILLHLPENQSRSTETAIANGYLIDDDSGNNLLYRWYRGGFVCSENWECFARDFKAASGGYELPAVMPTFSELIYSGVFLKKKSGQNMMYSLRDFETMTGCLLAAKDRLAAIVPIRKSYASQLFDDISKQRELFRFHDAVLRSERAYFLKSGRHAVVPSDALVLFYMSGSDKGLKEAFGVGRITFSETTNIDHILASLFRQGVLNKSELEKRMDGKERLAVFTFDNFYRLERGVPYAFLKSNNIINGANLISAQAISASQVEKVYIKSRGNLD